MPGPPGSSSPRRPSPNRASSAASASPCRAASSAASLRSPSSDRFASLDALAAIFVPSSATTPTRPIPSLAHKTRTCAKNGAAVSANRCRNRAIVTWSGARPAQTTRNATSCSHRASIRRDDVTPFAYAHTSSVTIMSGSKPAAPAPPVLRRAWNADVSSRRTASITSHTAWPSGSHCRMSGGSRNA